MSIRSRVIITAAVVGFGSASPAFAQSFSRGWGTGNSLPSYYNADGGLHTGTAPQPQQDQIAAQRSGLSAFASVHTRYVRH
jgi:hypothetical protein